MEYHNDRFEDFSLMVFKSKNLVAVLPSNVYNGELYSHQGLTFGGLLIQNKTTVNQVSEVYNVIRIFLKTHDIKFLNIKEIPEIYYKSPAFESGFVLSRIASLEKREMVLAIDYTQPFTIHKTKLKHFEKGKNSDFKIHENTDFKLFWDDVLEPRLKFKFGSKPVHSVTEIQNLNKLFPNNIKQYSIYKDGQVLAGITIFENEQIVKSQYGATTKEGEQYRALDYLFLHLIYKYKMLGKRFFSMGTVAGQDSLAISNGLLKQKQELGCQVYLQDFFKLAVND
jgi:hypothetical protein